MSTEVVDLTGDDAVSHVSPSCCSIESQSKRARHSPPVAPSTSSNSSGSCSNSRQQLSLSSSSELCHLPSSGARKVPALGTLSRPQAGLKKDDPILAGFSDDDCDDNDDVHDDVDDKVQDDAEDDETEAIDESDDSDADARTPPPAAASSDDETDIVDESDEGDDADERTTIPAAAPSQDTVLKLRSCGATDSKDRMAASAAASASSAPRGNVIVESDRVIIDLDDDTDTEFGTGAPAHTDRSESMRGGTDRSKSMRGGTDRSESMRGGTDRSESMRGGTDRSESMRGGTDRSESMRGGTDRSESMRGGTGTRAHTGTCGNTRRDVRPSTGSVAESDGETDAGMETGTDTDAGTDAGAAAGACSTVWHEKEHELIGREVAHRFNKHGNKVFWGKITRCLEKQRYKHLELHFEVGEGFPQGYERLRNESAIRAVALAEELREAESEAASKREAEEEESDLAQVLWMLGAKAHFFFASRAELKRLLEADATLFNRLSPPPPPPPPPPCPSLSALKSAIAAAEAALHRAEAAARKKEEGALAGTGKKSDSVAVAKRALRAAKAAKRGALNEQRQRWLFGLLDEGVAVRLDEHALKWWPLGRVDHVVKDAINKHSDASAGSRCSVAEDVFKWLTKCIPHDSRTGLGGYLPDQKVTARFTLRSWRRLATHIIHVRSMKEAAASGEPRPRLDLQLQKLLHIPVPNVPGLDPCVTAPSWLTEANWLSGLVDRDSTYKIKLQLAHAQSDTPPHRDNGGSDTWMRVLAGKVLVGCWSHADARRHGFSEPAEDAAHFDVEWTTVVQMRSARLFLLTPGQTLLMPAGTVHYVYTVEEKAVIAGDVLTICGWERRRQSCRREEELTEHEKNNEVEELLERLRSRVRAEADALAAGGSAPSAFRRDCLKRLHGVARDEGLQLPRRGDKGGGDEATVEAMRILDKTIAGW